MGNRCIILESYRDVYENLPANSRTIDVVIDDTDSDEEKNENTLIMTQEVTVNLSILMKRTDNISTHFVNLVLKFRHQTLYLQYFKMNKMLLMYFCQ